MALVLDEDQQMLREAARSFCRENVPVSVMRRLRDSRDPLGYDEDIWRRIVALGWTGMTVPQAYGGFEFGYTGLGIVLEESGRCLLNSPLISTVLLAGTAVSQGGNEDQKQRYLPGIVAGERVMALAIDERPHHDPSRVATRATRQADAYLLSGRKVMVLDGHIASAFVVSARTAGNDGDTNGISLFLVDAGMPGIKVIRTSMVDGRNGATVSFDQVQVGAHALLGERDHGYPILERVLDAGRIGVAAEMLGSAQEVFDRTIEYLKQREQFGVQIGAFQALQHRAAEMYCELELGRSLVLAALQALDRQPERVPVLASMVKAKLSEVFFRISNEGIQMHGGIGMTDEFDIGFFLKRARVAQQFLGDQLFHRDRYARLAGF